MLALNLASEEVQQAGFVLFEKLSQKFWTRLSIDIVSVFILIRFIYLPIYKNKEYFFTFFIFNFIIFLITFLLNKVEMSMGAAFGLFAVFSMLRYRTEGISLKDMTYLFLVIAVGLITAIGKGQWDELILLNGMIILVTYFMESNIFLKKEATQMVQYENIENIKPENKELLLEDLKTRTGLNITRVQIMKIDFLRDTASIKVHFIE
jgi:hypothetical protein